MNYVDKAFNEMVDFFVWMELTEKAKQRQLKKSTKEEEKQPIKNPNTGHIGET